MSPGDKIIYTYTHHYNRKSKATRVKDAVFVRWVTTRNSAGAKCRSSYAIIKVEGNKGNSRVHSSSIEKA